MLVEVKVPQLSESVSEATLLSWHKKPGEYVQRDENLIDIETDKVVLELPATESGVLQKIMKDDGATVTSNEVIATIDTEAKPSIASAPARPAPAAAPQAAERSAPAAVAKAPAAATAAAKVVEPIAMPAARKLAADKGVELTAIEGSGRGGRITKEDVVAQLNRPAIVKPAIAPPVDVDHVLGDRPEQRVPMSRLRQRVAQRLVESQSTAAILTTFNEVNMQPVMDLRKKYQERFEKEYGVRLGFMSFFVKAAVQGLKKYPVVNAS